MKAEITLKDLQRIVGEAHKNPAKLRRARKLIEDVLESNPDNWAVMFYLGAVLVQQEEFVMANIVFNRIIKERDDIPEVWNNLGTTYRKLHHNEKAETCLMKSLELNPDDADVVNNLGTLHINEGTPHEGERWLRQSLSMRPENNQARWNLGLCLLEQERWREGFALYPSGLASGDRIVKHYGNAVWWDGEPHPGKRMVIYGEQGLGDEIMFLSAVEDAIDRFGGRVVIECHPRLVGLVRRSFPLYAVEPTRKEMRPENYAYWVDPFKPDYKVSIGDLFRHVRSAGKFPKQVYLQADEARIAEYREWLKLLGPGPYIGLGWQGGHRETRRDLRSMGIGDLAPILELDGTFVSFQYNDLNREAEADGRIQTFPEVFEASKWERYQVFQDNQLIAETRTKQDAKQIVTEYGGEICHFPGPAYDYDETAAFAMAIQRSGGAIVTVNTSLVHLCGALGVKCFVLTPSKPAWRYGMKRRDMAFYGPHVRQYRQKGTDWSPALSELKRDLVKYLETEKEQAA